MIWNGGMSFHGGLIGVIIVAKLFSNKHNIDQFIFLDLVALSAPIGIFFGRIANFLNSELYGTPTEIPWSVKFVLVDNINRHPSQLYEAFFEGVILFLILNFVISKNTKVSHTTAYFLVLYSIFRFTIEFFRVPDNHIGYLMFNWVTMGQTLCIPMFILGLYILKIRKGN
jgi:phosphatidylglycerol:prolipoprotein diacylglycerol transferase